MAQPSCIATNAQPRTRLKHYIYNASPEVPNLIIYEPLEQMFQHALQKNFNGIFTWSVRMEFVRTERNSGFGSIGSIDFGMHKCTETFAF
jgi:hypothetical protein